MKNLTALISISAGISLFLVPPESAVKIIGLYLVVVAFLELSARMGAK